MCHCAGGHPACWHRNIVQRNGWGMYSMMGYVTRSGLRRNNWVWQAMRSTLLWFIGRRYVNLGTLIYILTYGLCMDFGSWVYGLIFSANLIWQRIAASIVGCLLLYFGVAIYYNQSCCRYAGEGAGA